ACTTQPSAPAAPVQLVATSDDPRGYSYVAEPLAPHVYALHQREPFHIQARGNVGVIEQSDGFVLMDSGGSPTGAEEGIRFLHTLSANRVKAMVFSHGHGDNSMGVARLLREWPNARVIATQSTKDLLSGRVADQYMPSGAPAVNARFQSNIA